MRAAKAFTLVEILIVVMLLGIMAAVVIPAIGRSGIAARETALASDLSLLRRFVLIYKSHHLEVPPGYPDGDPGSAPTGAVFAAQATLSTNANGQTAPVGTAGFNFGPYLSRVPVNPMNGHDTVEMVANGAAFPVTASDNFGWIFRPETGEIRADNIGANDRGTAYYDY
jgi:prepilin-type N-terminal cleavage/methylation domain-containing protein